MLVSNPNDISTRPLVIAIESELRDVGHQVLPSLLSLDNAFDILYHKLDPCVRSPLPFNWKRLDMVYVLYI